MNKLILTLGFGILASSAFAGNLEKDAKTAAKAHSQAKTAAHTAYTHAKTAGNVDKDAKTGEKFATHEYSQKDLRTDAQNAKEIMEKSGSVTKGQAMSDGKTAFSTRTDAA